jgi:hypothetical protein
LNVLDRLFEEGIAIGPVQFQIAALQGFENSVLVGSRQIGERLAGVFRSAGAIECCKRLTV